MPDFIHTKEKIIKENEPVIFENHTDSDFSVSAGIVFRESGLYRVIVDDGRTTVSKEPERKKGLWVFEHYPGYFTWTSTGIKLWPACSECGSEHPVANFCPNCGADMRKEDEE